MEFCSHCENKMNIKWNNIEEGTKIKKVLIYYCVTCGFNKQYDKNTIINPKLYYQNYAIDKSFITFNNEYLCKDPTLQKVSEDSDNKCPSFDEHEKKNIIYYIFAKKKIILQ